MTTAVREAPHHNTLTCYTNYGCRLPECVERKNEWARQRDRAMRAGTWQPHVDAAPLRAHIRLLMDAGLTPQRIANIAGVTHASISDFIQSRGARRGMRHRSYPEFAAKIMAIDPAAASPARVDATGAKRRIQALVAAGWPLLHVGTQLGMNPQRPEQILRQKRVCATTHTLIADGYPRLCDLRPERRGVPRHKARLARRHAKARRWPTTGYWADRMEVIDDPYFEPLYGITRREFVAQDAHWLMKTNGLDKTAAAERLGIDKSYIEHAFRDHPEYAIEVAA